MDAAAFEQVYQDFQEFHAHFAGLFGRRETRERSQHYLQVLLVQPGERRNAENLSETVPESARETVPWMSSMSPREKTVQRPPNRWPP